MPISVNKCVLCVKMTNGITVNIQCINEKNADLLADLIHEYVADQVFVLQDESKALVQSNPEFNLTLQVKQIER